MKHLLESAPTFDDWEGVHDAVADAYFPHDMKPRSRGPASHSGLEIVDLSVCRLAHMRFGATVDIVTEHPGATAINIQLEGSMESRVGSDTFTTTPGEAMVFPADTPARMPEWPADRAVLGLRIDSDYLSREAERVFARKHVQLPRVIDLRGAEGAAWLTLARTTFANARQAGGSLYTREQVAQSVASMLVTGLLLTAVADEDFPGGPTGMRPRPIRRVMDAIELDPARCWAPADLAEIAGVSVRRLQQCFRENVGTTPFAHLHEVRLERVHDDLVHGRGDNVTDVAMRWGVTHLGRFAAAYRTRYGQLPSQTLAASS